MTTSEKIKGRLKSLSEAREKISYGKGPTDITDFVNLTCIEWTNLIEALTIACETVEVMGCCGPLKTPIDEPYIHEQVCIRCSLINSIAEKLGVKS